MIDLVGDGMLIVDIDTATLDAVAENRTSTPVPETTTKEVKPAVADSKGGQGGGGGKKKKKGKK